MSTKFVNPNTCILPHTFAAVEVPADLATELQKLRDMKPTSPTWNEMCDLFNLAAELGVVARQEPDSQVCKDREEHLIKCIGAFLDKHKLAIITASARAAEENKNG